MLLDSQVPLDQPDRLEDPQALLVLVDHKDHKDHKDPLEPQVPAPQVPLEIRVPLAQQAVPECKDS